MTWAERVRLLKAHGFESSGPAKEAIGNSGNPSTKRIVTIAVHTKKDVGVGLLNRILNDAGATRGDSEEPMTRHFPVVLEHESNGTVSAYVVGLPGVFAAADSERAAATAIRRALRAHFVAPQALPVAARRVRTRLRVAKVSDGFGKELTIGVRWIGGGRRRSAKKAAAARANGRKGGRPRRASTR